MGNQVEEGILVKGRAILGFHQSAVRAMKAAGALWEFPNQPCCLLSCRNLKVGLEAVVYTRGRNNESWEQEIKCFILLSVSPTPNRLSTKTKSALSCGPMKLQAPGGLLLAERGQLAVPQ